MFSSSEQIPLPIEWVSRNIIRQIFNQYQYWEKAKAGEFIPDLRKDRHLDSPPKGKPYCTRSQYIVYWSQSREFMAGVHRYLRPDGTLGSRGKPDPNRIFIGDQIFAYSPKKSPMEEI